MLLQGKLELNSAGHRPSRAEYGDPSSRPLQYKWNPCHHLLSNHSIFLEEDSHSGCGNREEQYLEQLSDQKPLPIPICQNLGLNQGPVDLVDSIPPIAIPADDGVCLLNRESLLSHHKFAMKLQGNTINRQSKRNSISQLMGRAEEHKFSFRAI